MISLQNAARTAAKTGNINQVYSGPSQNSSVQECSEAITIESTDVATSFADFPAFTCEGYLLLELGRIRLGGLITNALNISVKLQRVSVGMVFGAVTTASSTAVTTSQTGLLVGMVVAGTGITAGTTIATITATGFTLSAATAATGFGSITITATGAADITAAQVAAATGAATAAQALPFVPVNGGTPVPFFKGDNLRLVITAVTTLGIGRTLLPSVPFISRNSPGLVP